VKRILFVGESPFSHFGNSGMMRSILSQLDGEKYQAAVYAANYDPRTFDPFVLTPFNTIHAHSQNDPSWGMDKLVDLVNVYKFDALIMIGIDLWIYTPVFEHLKSLRKKKGFVWGWLFPYDFQFLSEDMIGYANALDIPMVYSEYGYNMLKDHVPNLQYFRPPLPDADDFFVETEEHITNARNRFFPHLSNDDVIIGFVGKNQIRKDPQKLLEAYRIVRDVNKHIYLYLHTDITNGVYDLSNLIKLLKFDREEILSKNPTKFYSKLDMATIYNCLDCLINPTLQEGLAWPVVEAMLCGVPSILSKSTAHIELAKLMSTEDLLVEQTETTYLPVILKSGNINIPTKACSAKDLADTMLYFYDVYGRKTHELQSQMKSCAEKWLLGVSDINTTLEPFMDKKKTKAAKKRKEKAVLFAQHSAAGDVLMTTRCFCGIKAKHPDIPLVYMTQPQFQDIVTDNPYIDKIIDWDQEKLKEYLIVYNPHGERILPGGFNNLDSKLADLYPYFCKVEPDDFYIAESEPNVKLPEEYLVVHTTGGDPKYRTYSYMEQAVKDIDLPIVQIGGQYDRVCQVANVDLRGVLSFREASWIMSRASAAVVIDSFPAHLAAAVKTPVVVLFGPAPARVVGPIGDKDRMVFLEPNKLDVCPNLTSCWDGRLAQCQSPCINTINPMTVKEAVEKMLGARRTK
jgi:glycosyltransferase involved in cell wall biosynthesis